MCHRSILDFFHAEVGRRDIEGRSILEVGSRDVNGTMRPFLVSLGARHYLGVDIEPGPGVDRVCDVASLPSELAGQCFDVVVTTEMLEHVRDWRSAVVSLKRMVRDPSGTPTMHILEISGDTSSVTCEHSSGTSRSLPWSRTL